MASAAYCYKIGKEWYIDSTDNYGNFVHIFNSKTLKACKDIAARYKNEYSVEFTGAQY